MAAHPESNWLVLINLHATEDDVYALTMALRPHPHLQNVLRMIHDALDFMFEAAGEPQHTHDTRTISAIAGRIFNTTAGALREAFNGYPQTSFLLQRDLIEIHTLLDVFSHDLACISRRRRTARSVATWRPHRSNF